VKTVEAAVIGVGWVGGTRAETLARTALVDKLHLCEIRPDRLAEVKKLYKPATATLDFQVVDEAVVRHHLARLRASLDGPAPPLLREGFTQVVVLRDPAEVDHVRVQRHPT